MAGRATRQLNRAKSETRERLRYLNLVRRNLAPAYPPFVDFTRANADETFHNIWINNAMGAEKNWKYRVFREWSLVQRGKEEMKLTADEMQGVLLWSRAQAQFFRTRMDHETHDTIKRFWAQHFYTTVIRHEEWKRELEPWIQFAREYIHIGD
jgi:hypothetical protein